ncbi:MAG: 30S ribosomal protein S3 [Candidatus Latescibacteria bacterium]|nr:30S ribosomal protein S3 [Candidatus Latescibacterota bacterium]
MGQKTHPLGFRLGVIKTWKSRWFARQDFSELLREDLMLRKYVKSRFDHAGVSRVAIERAAKQVTLTIHTARPGIVIGRRGAEVDKLRDELRYLTQKEVYINIQEIKYPELDAQLVAENIANQLEQRVNYRRAVKRAVASAMKLGAKGIRIMCGGRIAGAEMARREQYREGSVPLHTLRADIDYGAATAFTTYGTIGVKVWIYKGEIIDSKGSTK